MFFLLVVARNLGTYEYDRQACFFVYVHIGSRRPRILFSCRRRVCVLRGYLPRYRGMNKDTERER